MGYSESFKNVAGPRAGDCINPIDWEQMAKWCEKYPLMGTRDSEPNVLLNVASRPGLYDALKGPHSDRMIEEAGNEAAAAAALRKKGIKLQMLKLG